MSNNQPMSETPKPMETRKPGTTRLMVFWPYCDRKISGEAGMAFSTYHLVAADGICVWCGRSKSDAAGLVTEITMPQPLSAPPSAEPVRCSGCGVRWTSPEGFILAGVVHLCGDCWRKVQPILHSAAQPSAEPTVICRDHGRADCHDCALIEQFGQRILRDTSMWSRDTPESYAQRDIQERFRYMIWINVKCVVERELTRAAQPSAAPKDAQQFVDGYDAIFWRDSYVLLRDAIMEHLREFIHDDDVAEEAILVKAVEDAGKRLASSLSETPAGQTLQVERELCAMVLRCVHIAEQPQFFNAIALLAAIAKRPASSPASSVEQTTEEPNQ
jgi:hypothetical protein